MSIIVETIYALAADESYLSVVEADDYHAKMGNTSWASFVTPQKEQYLRRATRYMISQYRARWQGQRTVTTQPLDWPRAGVVIDGLAVDSTIIPMEVMQACAEFALRAATGALLPDTERKTLSESVGPLSVTYDPNAPQQTRYIEVEGLLAPYFGGTGSSSNMMRLVRS